MATASLKGFEYSKDERKCKFSVCDPEFGTAY